MKLPCKWLLPAPSLVRLGVLSRSYLFPLELSLVVPGACKGGRRDVRNNRRIPLIRSASLKSPLKLMKLISRGQKLYKELFSHTLRDLTFLTGISFPLPSSPGLS